MDISLTEEQEMLRTSIRSLCEDYFTTTKVRECEANPQAANALKSMLAELGASGLLLPEALGGLGLGMVDAVVVQSELGRALTPPHLAETSVLGLTILAGVAAMESDAKQAPSLALQQSDIAWAWCEDDSADGPHHASVRFDSSRSALNGRKSFVSWTPEGGGYFLVTARDEDGAPVLCLAAAQSQGVSAIALANLTDAPMADITFTNAAATVLMRGDAAQRLWTTAFDRMLIALAAQAVGGAERALEIATEYAKTRQQFGQAIGAFQAIAHHLADAAVNVEGARYLTYRAAAAADDGEDFSTWAAMAKLKACKTFRDVSALCIQIHGGIGFTLEADPQLFYRRAKHLQLIYGDPMLLEERIGAAVTSGKHKALHA